MSQDDDIDKVFGHLENFEDDDLVRPAGFKVGKFMADIQNYHMLEQALGTTVVDEEEDDDEDLPDAMAEVEQKYQRTVDITPHQLQNLRVHIVRLLLGVLNSTNESVDTPSIEGLREELGELQTWFSNETNLPNEAMQIVIFNRLSDALFEFIADWTFAFQDAGMPEGALKIARRNIASGTLIIEQCIRSLESTCDRLAVDYLTCEWDHFITPTLTLSVRGTPAQAMSRLLVWQTLFAVAAIERGDDAAAGAIEFPITAGGGMLLKILETEGY